MKKYQKMIFVCALMTILAAAGGTLMRDGVSQEGSEMNEEKKDKSRKGWNDQTGDSTKRQYLPDSGLRIPTVKEVSENPYIYRYNHGLGREKGLLKEDCLNDHYLCLQAVYRANLDAYLMETLDIRALDEELKNSGFGFVSHKAGNRNLYEEESTMGLEFIYLRNNLYIEYLGKGQLELLERCLEKGAPYVTDTVRTMAKETYRETVRVRDPGDWEDVSGFYYPEAQGSKPVIPNHALVLGIANGAGYDASGMLMPDEGRRAKYEYLDKIKEEKEKEYSEILGTEVYILVE